MRRAHPAITGWMERAAELSVEDDFEWEEKCKALGDARCMWTFKRLRKPAPIEP